MTTHNQTRNGGEQRPDLKRLLGTFTRKHFVMAADEWKEGASDHSVRRHYDEANEAKMALITEIDRFESTHAALTVRVAELREALEKREKLAANLHAVLMGAHGLITMCREHFIERELAACDGNFLFAQDCLTAIQKINRADKEFCARSAVARAKEGKPDDQNRAASTYLFLAEWAGERDAGIHPGREEITVQLRYGGEPEAELIEHMAHALQEFYDGLGVTCLRKPSDARAKEATP